MSTASMAAEAIEPHNIAEQSSAAYPSPPPTNLPSDDGEPMESPWHAGSGPLIKSCYVAARGGLMTDYYVGVNMFVYFSWQQVRNVDYKGPDIFFVHGADGQRERLYWAVWEEAGRYPDVIIELLSDTTEKADLGVKKQLYEQTFNTTEYFCIAAQVQRLLGWRLSNGVYTPIEPDAHGRLWSERLGCAIGPWQGVWLGEEDIWPRLFRADGTLLPTPDEASQAHAESEKQRAEAETQRAESEKQRAEAEQQRAEAEQQRAEAEQQRADAALRRVAELEAELARLRGGA